MSTFATILSIIGFILKTILDSAINTSTKVLFGLVLLIQTIAGALGAGQTLSTIIAIVLVVAIVFLVFKWLWGTARVLVLVVIGIIAIALILSIIAPGTISATP